MKWGILSLLIGLSLATSLQANPPVALEENFTQELSKDWFWGLGTWTVKDGILSGFESGPRRHGPVKMRRFPLKDGIVECGFKLEGKASFAGIIFNGSQERGHIVHLVMSRDVLRVLVHPRKGENIELFKESFQLLPGTWHQAHLEFVGSMLTATVDGHTIQVNHPAIGEEKQTFGLGGDSGGPEGEKAGHLEFRQLRIMKN